MDTICIICSNLGYNGINLEKIRYTPESIETLRENEIFVFGSNLSGLHEGGAARKAVDEFGARNWQAYGLQGQSFAIPTKGWEMSYFRDLSLTKMFVTMFIREAHAVYPHLTFLVTKIGCGLAGFSEEQIAPLFVKALDEPNIILPKEFHDILNK